MPIERNKIKVCCLCGKELRGKVSEDHTPPKQFYGSRLRKEHNVNLLTLPVHDVCNKSYQNDEDYFVYSMSALGARTYSGSRVLEDIANRHKRGKQRKLLRKIFSEWEKRPSGLHLPEGKIIKRIEGERIHRVAWKIVRGLFYYNEGRVLPESTPNQIEYVAPKENPPDTFFALDQQTNRGQYPGVFDYRYQQFPEIHNMYYWAMLFWDAVMILIAFHDPECSCENCEESRTQEASHIDQPFDQPIG